MPTTRSELIRYNEHLINITNIDYAKVDNDTTPTYLIITFVDGNREDWTGDDASNLWLLLKGKVEL